MANFIPSLARLEKRDLLRRVLSKGSRPACLSLVVTSIAVCLLIAAERIGVGAVAGILAIAIWKLLTYATFILMGLAFVTSSMRVGRLFRWVACVLAGTTFDAMAEGLGVFMGILPAVVWELGARGAFVGLYLVMFAVTGMGVMCLPARMLYGTSAPEVLEHRWVRLALGLVFVVAAMTAVFAERWPELASVPITASATAARA
jgi:hypothetical protein